MTQFFLKQINIQVSLLLCLSFLLLPSKPCKAENFLLDIDTIKILKDDISSDFFLDLQNISSETEYVQKSVALLKPGLLESLKPDSSSFSQFSENQNIVDVFNLIENGELAEAAVRLKAVNNFSGRYPYILYLEGWIHFKKGEYMEAVKKFSLLLKAYDGYGHGIEVSLLNAFSYSGLGDFNNSKRFLNRARKAYRREIMAVKAGQADISDQGANPLLSSNPDTLFKEKRIPDIFKRFLLDRQVIRAYENLWFLDQLVRKLAARKNSIAKSLTADLSGLVKRISETDKKIRNADGPGNHLSSLKEHLAFLKNLQTSLTEKNGNEQSVVSARVAVILDDISRVRSHIFQAVKTELQKKYRRVVATKDTLPAWLDFYTSRLYYREYLKRDRPRELLRPAVDAHTAYIKEHRERNFTQTKEVVNRLIDLRYDLDGFNEEIVSLYRILIDSRLANDRETADSRFELGTAYYNNGEYEKAGEVFRNFHLLHPESAYTPSVLFLTGEILLKKGEREEALRYFEMASSHVNTYFALPSLYRRGWLSEKLGDTEQAVKLFSEALLYIEEFKNGLIDIPVPEEKQAIEELSGEIVKEAINTITNNLYENGKTDKLFRYFEKHRDAAFLPRILVSFSRVYKLQMDYSSHIELYRQFLFKFPEKHTLAKILGDLLKEYDEDGLLKYSELIREFLISFYDDEKYTAIDRSIFRELVAECYVKSAAYHHFLARQTNDSGEYAKAIRFYRQYIGNFNDQKNIIEVNLLLARLLAEKGDSAEAGIEYTKVAWEYPHRETKNLQKKAALAAVDLLYRHIQKNREPSQKILNLFYLAAELFVSVFPDSIESTKVLYFVGDKQFIEKDYENALGTFGKVIEMAPDRSILLKSMQRLALAHYYSGNYLEAKVHFQSLMSYILTSALPDSTRRGNILYKVGDTYYSLNSYDRFSKSLKAWRDGVWIQKLTEELRGVINANGSADNIYKEYERKFARLISPFKEEDRKLLLYSQEMVVLSTLNLSDIYIQEKRYDDAVKLLFEAAVLTKEREAGPHYLYRAATLYFQKEELDTAYSIFKFVERSEEVTKDKKYKYPVLMQLAFISDKLKKQHELVNNLLKVTELKNIDKSKKMDAVAKAGFAYQAVGNHREALKMFERYIVAASPEMKRYKELSFSAGEEAERLGDTEKARKYYQKAIKAGEENNTAGKESYFPAAAGFKITELDYKKYGELKEGGDLKKYLAIRQKKMNTLIRAYSGILRSGILEFTSASFYRIASLYEDFANTFKNSPLPPGLTRKQEARYTRLLSKKIRPLEEKAMKAYAKNLEFLREKKFNKWIEMSLISYSRLNPMFTLKAEEIVGITHIIEPLSLKTPLSGSNGVQIPSFEPLVRDSVTSTAH